MPEERKSLLYKLKPVTDRLPAVTRPEGHVHFRTKMMWVVLILVLYFALTNIYLYGLDQTQTVDLFAGFRTIMAGAQGSLMHLGIGPIVTGSIIMQLFTGAKIIKLDLTKEEDKAIYQSTQKLVVIIMIAVESIPQVFGYLVPSDAFRSTLNGFLPGQGENLALFLIVLQLCFGCYVVFLMDEVVSKWGIGSGVSLFIAAGVAQAIFTGTFNWMPGAAGAVTFDNPPAGTIPKTLFFLNHMSADQLAGGGYERMWLQNPNPIVALLGTIVVFFLVAYIESSRIELPLAHGTVRGARGRYPIRLIYASNIPVILMSAVLANVTMFTLLFWSHPSMSQWPVLGHNWMIGGYPTPEQQELLAIGPTTPISGLAYYLSPIAGLGDWLLPLMNPDGYGYLMRGHEYYQVMAHVLVYSGVMIVGSVMFAKFWISTTGMGPEDVAKQIEGSGMQIPGFRRDPKVIRKVLDRYIPVVTVISGAAIGALAAGADMIGTVGNASGVGVLLTVGILIQLYEAIGREQMMEMHPVIRQFFAE
ncbi:MAG: preprotein translocase subunit SecY [Thermoplasmata archaeon]|nr:preprotein translocase subunit SecY [Thermoplasmata archaeon]